MRPSRQFGVVRHHDDCRTGSINLLQEIHDLSRHERVEITRWFVGKQEHRITG